MSPVIKNYLIVVRLTAEGEDIDYYMYVGSLVTQEKCMYKCILFAMGPGVVTYSLSVLSPVVKGN